MKLIIFTSTHKKNSPIIITTPEKEVNVVLYYRNLQPGIDLYNEDKYIRTVEDHDAIVVDLINPFVYFRNFGAE